MEYIHTHIDLGTIMYICTYKDILCVCVYIVVIIFSLGRSASLKWLAASEDMIIINFKRFLAAFCHIFTSFRSCLS